MKQRIIRITVLVIVVIFAWFYLLPYGVLIFSPFSWKEADINKDGFVSPGEAGYVAYYGNRQKVENGKNCIEYFALKDGLPIKQVCK